MCGCYYVSDEMVRELERVIKNIDTTERVGRQDIFPSQKGLVLAERCRDLRPEPMIWGFPKYTGNGLIINARSETALESGMFRDSLLRRRCIVPAGGFYEWNRAHEMVVFTSGNMPVLYMAGFYSIFGDQYRYVILTTEANQSVAPVHPRMPLVLEESEIRDWIFDTDFMKQTLSKTPLPLVKAQEYEQQTMGFIL